MVDPVIGQPGRVPANPLGLLAGTANASPPSGESFSGKPLSPVEIKAIARTAIDAALSTGGLSRSQLSERFTVSIAFTKGGVGVTVQPANTEMTRTASNEVAGIVARSLALVRPEDSNVTIQIPFVLD